MAAEEQPAAPVTVGSAEIVLRGYDSADVDDLMLAFADPDIVRWNAGPRDRAGVAAWMNRRNDWSAGDHFSWAVAAADGRMLGSVSLHRVDLDQRDAEIGYWLAPWARGRGVASRAVALAASYGFGTAGLHRIYLFHAVENTPSCRVAVAAGFPLEGRLRESYRYADGRYHDEHLHGRLASDPVR